MLKHLRRLGVSVVALTLVTCLTITPAFALVREVQVYGVKSINDMGQSDQRVDMDQLKDDYSDFVQADTLREYFHKDQDSPQKVDLGVALSWLVDNNIISRDVSVTVSNVGGNSIPSVNITKFDGAKLSAMDVMRTDMVMYLYKAAFGPINARSIGVETDNVRVDDGQYITLRDLMIKNGYTVAPSNVLPGSGHTSTPGSPGSSGTGNGGGGASGSGSSEQTNYINDASNWRYQPQGDLWESIFGDTNIFISENNFQQGIVGGNAGGGGGGGAGVGGGGGGGHSGNTAGNQTQVNTGDVGSIHGSDDTLTSTDSNNINANGNPQAGSPGNAGPGGSGSGGDFSTGNGGSGGNGGNANTGDNYIDYDTDYKQIYFIPGADVLFYDMSEVPEVYIQAALSKGVLDFDSDQRTEEFNKVFVEWPKNNPGKYQSWEKNSPAYVVNRSRNILKTVSNTNQVATQFVLGKHWNVSWQRGTLNITRNSPFENTPGYFKSEVVSKMDAYRYVYHFIVANEKVLSDLERDIVNYKYGMELDSIASSEDIDIIKYLIAKGIINYDVTTEFMNLGSPLAWSDFLTLLYRTANKDARLDFSEIQLTDSETQWKAAGYAPQTRHIIEGDNLSDLSIMTLDEYMATDFGTDNKVTVFDPEGIDGGYEQVATQSMEGDRQFVRFGASADTLVVGFSSKFGEPIVYGLTSSFGGAALNKKADASEFLKKPEGVSDYDVGVFLGLRNLPTTNAGKYTMYRLYEMATCQDNNKLGADPTTSYDESNPKHQLYREVAANLWVITAALEDRDQLGDIFGVLAGAEIASSSSEMKERVGGTYIDNYKASVKMLYNCYADNAVTEAKKIHAYKFLFDDGSANTVTTDWVTYTGGDINTLVDRIAGVEFTFTLSDGTEKTLVYEAPTLAPGETRSGGTEQTAVEQGNDLSMKIVEQLEGKHWTPQQRAEYMRNYSNNVTTFSNLESITNTPGLLSYVDSETSECFIAWSTLERYKQTCTDTGKEFPIIKKSDYLLYNEATDTSAYFSDKDGKKIALVGTDVVEGDSDRGVVYKEDNEVYYHIDALRLLMDAKQEAAVLGGVRAMPLASTVVQRSLTSVKLDMGDGIETKSLTGISVLLSDSHTDTKALLENKGLTDSVYFTEVNSYGNLQWGKYIAVSQANRAINVISRQFAYNTDEGKKIAYAVVVFEPKSAGDIGTAYVNPSSSLQDLLDAPMKAPESEDGKAIWQQNHDRCNAFANWIYGTTGYEYITTGYLEPHAYIYAGDAGVVGSMSQSDWSPLTTEQQELVEVVALKDVTHGAVMRFSEKRSDKTKDVCNDPDHRASYMLSEDYRVCIMGNRLYMHIGCFKHIATVGRDLDNMSLRVTGIMAGTASFTVGSTFEINGYTGSTQKIDGDPIPTVTVVQTETDGTVTCQVGPIIGVPLDYKGTTKAVIRGYTDKCTSVATMGDYDWTDKENDKLRYTFDKLFSQSAYRDITFEGISNSPYLTADSARRYVYDGTKLTLMTDDSRITAGRSFSYYAESIMGADDKVSSLLTSRNSQTDVRYAGCDLTSSNIETYYLIKFNAFQYTVKGGILTYEPNQASDFISASLFTSLNDLIINEMVNEDNGAIPIEDIPFGCILEIGTGYYTATGTSSEDIYFVGYAPMEVQGSSTGSATLQTVAPSYAGQFIRAGNKPLNVSHFFKDITVLSQDAASESPSKDSLEVIRSNVLVNTQMTKMAVYANGGSLGSMQTKTLSWYSSSPQTHYYAPVSISFQPGLLMAYVCSAQGDEPATYRLVSTAKSAVTGPLDNLPFFTDNMLSSGMTDRTGGMFTGGFIQFYGAPKLLEQVRQDFQKVFAGDLFTLARMLIFIILIWLVVASWMCYATYFGGLMPILDAIRYPTGSREGKGIDLMKIVSLGSISMETDFKLGRFIQYNAVLAALICVVWMTGSITI